jgi:hypothetical protein
MKILLVICATLWAASFFMPVFAPQGAPLTWMSRDNGKKDLGSLLGRTASGAMLDGVQGRHAAEYVIKALIDDDAQVTMKSGSGDDRSKANLAWINVATPAALAGFFGPGYWAWLLAPAVGSLAVSARRPAAIPTRPMDQTRPIDGTASALAA